MVGGGAPARGQRSPRPALASRPLGPLSRPHRVTTWLTVLYRARRGGPGDGEDLRAAAGMRDVTRTACGTCTRLKVTVTTWLGRVRGAG